MEPLRLCSENMLSELEHVLYQSDLGPVGTKVVQELQTAFQRREIVFHGNVFLGNIIGYPHGHFQRNFFDQAYFGLGYLAVVKRGGNV